MAVIQGRFLTGRPNGAGRQSHVLRAAPVAPERGHHAPPPTAWRQPVQPSGATAIARPGPPTPAGRPASAGPAGPSVAIAQRRAAASGIETWAVDTSRVDLRGPGRPLPDPLRTKMERLFGQDFADVRVHVGPQAQAVGALAFTMGSGIWFAPGQWEPHSPRGQQLLGHELAHVVQQRQGRVRGVAGVGVTVVQDRALEAEADRMGERAAAASPHHVPTFAVTGGQPVTQLKLAQAKQRQALSTLRTIQRDVGFEFQTQYNVERRGSVRRSVLGPKFRKGKPLYSRNDWSLTADGPEIEFITDHFPESAAGRLQLIASITDLVAFCSDLEARMQATALANAIIGNAIVSVTNAELNAGGGGVAPLAPAMGTKLTLSTSANAIPFMANPQATAGVRLKRIRNLYTDLGTANSDATKELAMGGILRRLFANAAADAANATVANGAPPLSNKMIGLLTEILGLIRRAGVVVNMPRPYAKMGALLLNRTNFVAVYNMLSLAERNYYSTNGGQPFVDLVRTAENNQLSGAPLNMNGQLMQYSVFVDANNAAAGQIQLPLTRRDWLRGITQGRDNLTAARNRNMQKHSDGTHPLREFGLLGMKTDAVNNNANRGVVLEFRDIRRMSSNDWIAFATDVFDYIKALNEWNGIGAAPVYNAHGRV
jgi:hypothetical protein